MKRLFRLLVRTFVGISLLSIISVVLVYWLATRSLPNYEASYQFDGVSESVEIVRTNMAVPHIFAQNDNDVFFGLGFAHAQDRLWQMTILRRTVQGRLSEVFGERTVPIDDLMRRLDLANISNASMSAQSEETLAALEAYSAGVNAWIAEINRQALGRGAPEFFLFSNPIAPWRPEDSVAILKLLAFQQTTQLQTDILRARTSLVLAPSRLADIMPDAPGSGIVEFPTYSKLFPGIAPDTDFVSSPLTEDPLSPVRHRTLAGASNAWAATQMRTLTGKSILANDPHSTFTAPSNWYLARLELATGGVIGATVPGLPFILAGRNKNLAWGITASFADDQDVFIEKLKPDDPNEVLTPNGFKPLMTRPSIINVRGRAPVTVQLRWSENGPVLPPEHYNLSTVTPSGYVAAISWTAFAPEDASITSMMQLMRAQSVEEGIAAAELFVAPSFNLTLADNDQIALKTIGALPNRAPENLTKGRLPSAGWVQQNRWSGQLSYQSNPEFLQPPSSIVGNTNNKILDRPFPYHVSYNWGDTQRIGRLQTLLQSRKLHTRESFMEAQLDTVSPTARSLLPLIAANLWYAEKAASPGTLARKRRNALDVLADWNGDMSEHLSEPLIYAAWMRALQRRISGDELGDLASEFMQVEPVFLERVFRDTDGASIWCDVIQSRMQETCDQMASLALDDALQWLDETNGEDLLSLTWGDAHQATQDSPLLGASPLTKWFANIRQPTSGGDFTLSRGLTKGTDPEPFLNVHGPGYRGVYDFSDPDSSVFVISTGQSGHLFSNYYDDQSELWRRGEYIPMSLDQDLARAGSAGITNLFPQRK